MTQSVFEPYPGNLEHLLSNVALLDLRLISQVQSLRVRNESDSEGEFKGLFVSENVVESIISRLSIGRVAEVPLPEPLLGLIEQQDLEIKARTQLSLNENTDLRMERLRNIFQLSDFEVGVLTLCIAPELDLNYGTIYAYLQDDVNKTVPTVNLALNLFCSSLHERVVNRTFLFNRSPLVEYGLVHVSQEVNPQSGAFLGNLITPDQRIVDYLLGSESIDRQLRPFARIVNAPLATWDDVVLPADFKSHLMTVVSRLAEKTEHQSGSVLQLIGSKGVGKKTIAQAVCWSLQRDLLVIDVGGMLTSDLPSSKLVALAFREALLTNAVLCIDDFQLLLEEDSQRRALLGLVSEGLRRRDDLTILAGESHWRGEGEFPDHAFLTLRVPPLEFSERKRLWDIHLNGNGHHGRMTSEEIASISGRFRLQGGQIRQVVATARDVARFRPDSDGELTLEDLNAASRLHSNQRLGVLAQKIVPIYLWDDIVLPADQKQQLREVCNYFANMALVYGKWGFQSKTNLGKGLNILFAGSSGTGKTMASDIMAGELGLDLYKIDLSTIISKYIGETEKNLDRIFQEAEDSNAILFFDEADALFGKRSEVRDSHDRYANIEVSYLLQKMEEYQGIVILATNFRKNMDDAFVRRMHFMVEFPVPEERDRLEIWRRVFPAKAPLDSSVDLKFVARQFKLTGGNIKNIAVTSAFLAAKDSNAIRMEHVILATRREYQKMGKLLLEGEFGEYFDLVKAKTEQ